MRYTPDYLGDQLTTAVTNNEKVDVSDFRGKLRIAYFSFTADGAVAADSVIGLCEIPEKARVLQGAYKHSAYGASRTLDIGLFGLDNSGNINDTGPVADDPDFFVDGDDVSAAGGDTFGKIEESDKNALYRTEKRLMLAATILGDTLPDAGTLEGYIVFAVD